MEMITVTILTKDNEATLEQTLESVKGYDVLVLDTGSSDGTLEIAKRYGARIEKSPFIGFGKLKNLAAELAEGDWILSLDADEVLSADLPKELDEACIYSFPFHNYFNGKWIKGCGWYPDRHVRLYHKVHARFSDDQVHEKLHGGREVKLGLPIRHYSYRSIDDFLRKMDRYSSLFAEQREGKKSSLGKALLHSWWAFFKSYIIKRGVLCGREGFIISQYNAHVAYYKYLKLAC